MFGDMFRRVQLIHLRTDITAPREIASHNSLLTLVPRGIQYVEQINPLSTTIPRDVWNFCRRPADIAADGKPGFMRITPAAWGCYKAHRDALWNLSADADYTLICECDAGLAVPVSEFCWIVNEAIERMERGDVYFVHLAPPLEYFIPEEERPHDDLFVNAWYQISTACYMVPNHHVTWYRQRISDCEWDSADMWFNHIFNHYREIRLRTYRKFAGVFTGQSLLDNEVKGDSICLPLKLA